MTRQQQLERLWALMVGAKQDAQRKRLEAAQLEREATDYAERLQRTCRGEGVLLERRTG